MDGSTVQSRAQHYIAGRADFFAGRVPHAPDARTLAANYDTLTPEQKLRADGFFDARDDQRMSFAGTLPRSERPMLRIAVQKINSADDDASSTSQARKRGEPKAPRRKGRNAIVLRWNAGGTSITWQGQCFMLDGVPDRERERIIANITAQRYGEAQ